MRPEARTAERPFARVMPSSARPAAARARRSARPTHRRLTLLLPRLLLPSLDNLLKRVKVAAARTRSTEHDDQVTKWPPRRVHFSSTCIAMCKYKHSVPEAHRSQALTLSRSPSLSNPLSRHAEKSAPNLS